MSRIIRSSPEPGGWKNGTNRAYLNGDCRCNRLLFDQIIEQITPEVYFELTYRYYQKMKSFGNSIAINAIFTLPDKTRIIILQEIVGRVPYMIRLWQDSDNYTWDMSQTIEHDYSI